MVALRIRSKSVARQKAGKTRRRVTVVGIGASAGGLEAFRAILERLPAHSGMALVFIQHLDPTRNSYLRELLEQTSPIPVYTARQGMRVEQDRVYVIPSNAILTIADGRLWLEPRKATAATTMPVDTFLRSLASEMGSRAIGVILSGNASDGVLGLKAIKAAGGIALAQDV